MARTLWPLLGLLTFACSAPPSVTGPSDVKFEMATLQLESGHTQFVPGPNSCPHDIPANWRVIGGETAAKFRFDPVPGALMYTIEIREYEGHMVQSFPTEHFDDLKRSFAEGRYEARIQTRVCGPDGESQWSAWDDFTVGTDTVKPVQSQRAACLYCHPRGIPVRRQPPPEIPSIPAPVLPPAEPPA